MIIRVHGLTGETPRLHEYSPVFDPRRFAAHEKFFVDDVGRWARSRFGVYLFAGTREPFFLDNASRWAQALRHAGADVVLSEQAASHGAAQWRGAFPLMVAWAFDR